MKQLLILFIFIIPLSAQTSTFVGNGGGQGDVELAVTLRQLEETFRAIIDHKDTKSFCECNPVFEGRSVCDILKSLKEDQKLYCAQTIRAQAPDLLRKLTNADPRINWTRSEIEVSENGKLRAVDAVTNAEKNEITINLDRFLDMAPYERVFLLSHELMHLTTIEGKRPVDEGPSGPFTGSDGGRDFLNAVGSGIAVLRGQYSDEIGQYRSSLRRSQSWKHFWFETLAGSSNRTKEPNTGYGFKEAPIGEFSFKYVYENIYLIVGSRFENANKKYLGSIDVKENSSIMKLGAGYRFFPGKNPLRFSGQMHFAFQATYDSIFSQITMKDAWTSTKKDVSSSGYSLSAQFYMPLFWGIWGSVGAGYENHPYKYPDMKLKYEGSKTNGIIGVAYAF